MEPTSHTERSPLIIDARPLYPEVVAVNVSRGVAARLRERASAEGTSRAVLIRRALEQLLAAPPSGEISR